MLQGIILPALEVLTLEHRLREQDFVSFTHHSSVIPPGREALYGKGLFLGYDLEFAASLHLLVPQIEHMVPSQLKAAGAITTTIDHDGIEDETGLSALVKLTQMTQCFSDDLAFELTALFCDPLGPNLRNNVAHGLLDFDACRSMPSMDVLVAQLPFDVQRVLEGCESRPGRWGGRNAVTAEPDGSAPGLCPCLDDSALVAGGEGPARLVMFRALA